MSALRQPTADVLPGLRAVPLRGEHSVKLAARCLPADQQATLETIVHYRTPPTGAPLEWEAIAAKCGLANAGKDPLRKLRPYGWTLAALLIAGEGLTFSEAARHLWVDGLIAPSTLYNKRDKATLAGGLNYTDFVTTFSSVRDAELKKIAEEIALEDGARTRKALLKTLSLVEAQQIRITPSDADQLQLGFGIEELLGKDGKTGELDRLDREDKLSKIHLRQKDTVAGIHRELRLVNSLDPDLPQDAAGNTPEATPERRAQLETELAEIRAQRSAIQAEQGAADA